MVPVSNFQEFGSKLHFFADKNEYDVFFSKKLIKVVKKLDASLAHSTILIFPDAILKSNQLPTGIACITEIAHTLLLPYILRDPGCGYLMFHITNPPNKVATLQASMGKLLNEMISSPHYLNKHQKKFDKLFLQNILLQGLAGIELKWQEKQKFQHASFAVHHDIDLSKEEMDHLREDFMWLTNTIEIRQISDPIHEDQLTQYHLGCNDYIGFIHTGSLHFPKILADRFSYQICEFADRNALFSLQQIREGIVGVPLCSELGQRYQSWIHAAMNYVVVSRYYLYLSIKEELEAQLGIEISLMNDVMHAGLFQINQEKKYCYAITRGAQLIGENQLRILAGQRESQAALVRGAKGAMDDAHFFSHGINDQILNEFDYHKKFSAKELQNYLEDAKQTYYNSHPYLNECIPYTYLLHRTCEIFKRSNILREVAYLNPFVNIQSDWLKRGSDRSNKIKQ